MTSSFPFEKFGKKIPLYILPFILTCVQKVYMLITKVNSVVILNKLTVSAVEMVQLLKHFLLEEADNSQHAQILEKFSLTPDSEAPNLIIFWHLFLLGDFASSCSRTFSKLSSASLPFSYHPPPSILTTSIHSSERMATVNAFGGTCFTTTPVTLAGQKCYYSPPKDIGKKSVLSPDSKCHIVASVATIKMETYFLETLNQYEDICGSSQVDRELSFINLQFLFRENQSTRERDLKGSSSNGVQCSISNGINVSSIVSFQNSVLDDYG
ncbi:hypothetical protein STEG23_006099, partial [Scotinomys teguina]